MQIYNWFAAGFMNHDLKKFLISDFVGDTCKSIPDAAPWTYTQGVVLNGLSNLYAATKEEKYIESAVLLVNGVMNLLVAEQNGKMVLAELNEIEDMDVQFFKGIFIRNLNLLLTNDDLSLFSRTLFEQFIKESQTIIQRYASEDMYGATWTEAPVTCTEPITDEALYATCITAASQSSAISLLMNI